MVTTVGLNHLRLSGTHISAPQKRSRWCPVSQATSHDEHVKLRLSMHYKAEFGEQLRLVGNLPQLGRWVVADAALMQWKDDHTWETEVELPRGEEAQFKAVLLSHNANVWEPGSDRTISSEDLGSHATARLAWGLTDQQQIESCSPAEGDEDAVSSPGDIASSEVVKEFDELWNPAKSGLPEDITLELNTPQQQATAPPEKSGNRFDVTLEPDDTVIEAQEGTTTIEAQGKEESGNRLDVTLEPEDAVIEAQEDTVVEAQEKMVTVMEAQEDAAVEAQDEVYTGIETQEAAVVVAQSEVAEGQQDSTVLHASRRSSKREMWLERMVPKVAFNPDAGTVEERRRGASGLQMGLQAGATGLATVATAAVLTALGVEVVTETLVASAVVFAGASFLHGIVEANRRRQAKAGKRAVSPVLGAAETGLKATSMIFGQTPQRIESSKAAQPKEDEVEGPVAQPTENEVKRQETGVTYSNNAVSSKGLTTSKDLASKSGSGTDN